MERKVIVEHEGLLRMGLRQEELELRGLALCGLQIDKSFWRLTDEGSVEVRLVRAKGMPEMGE